MNPGSFDELNLKTGYIAQLHGPVFIMVYSVLSIQCYHTPNNLGLYVVTIFKTILLEEQSFNLQSEIPHIGIFHSLCSATKH